MANYDVMILGSGPAGLAAAIYASRAALKTAVVEKEMISGGQIINTYEVDNYPGLPGIGGFDLAEKFREHSDKMGTEYITGEVTRIEDLGATKKVYLADGQVFETATVIIATGARHRHLDVPGELQFTGAGVSYCATCDGAFFRGKALICLPELLRKILRDLSRGELYSRRRQWHPTPVLLPGESHGWRSLVGCSPWGC